MTDAALEEAFRLRIQGLTWEQVADQVHYCPSTIRRELHSVLSNSWTAASRIVYPAIRSYLMREGLSIHAFADRCGVSYRSMVDVLPGKIPPSPYIVRKVMYTIGLDEGLAWAREEEPT